MTRGHTAAGRCTAGLDDNDEIIRLVQLNADQDTFPRRPEVELQAGEAIGNGGTHVRRRRVSAPPMSEKSGDVDGRDLSHGSE
jgi:hypothetical protein